MGDGLITLGAETPGGVNFTGQSNLSISGSHLLSKDSTSVMVTLLEKAASCSSARARKTSPVIVG